MAGNNNSGRKPDWFKYECARIISDEKLINFWADVFTGRLKIKTFIKGVELPIESSPDVSDRLRASELLVQYAFGKPAPYVFGNQSPSDSVENVEKTLAFLKSITDAKRIPTNA